MAEKMNELVKIYVDGKYVDEGLRRTWEGRVEDMIDDVSRVQKEAGDIRYELISIRNGLKSAEVK
jgi:hypothetical protein